MGYGSGPPDPGLPQAVFNALHAMTYNSTNKAFADAGGSMYWLFMQQKVSFTHYYEATWFYATDTDGSTSPKGLISQTTANVITGGTFDTTNDCIDYSSLHYRIRLSRDVSGNQYAEAYSF